MQYGLDGEDRGWEGQGGQGGQGIQSQKQQRQNKKLSYQNFPLYFTKCNFGRGAFHPLLIVMAISAVMRVLSCIYGAT